MNAPAHHAITLAAPRDIASGKAPVILQRNDEDFIEAILEDLKSPASRSGLQADLAATRNADQILKLFQPTQRLFHVALIEAWCATPGTPRLDPARVDAAGMVLRRQRSDAAGTPYLEGWMRAAGRLRGWVPTERIGDSKADPQPAVRRAGKATGRPAIDRALAKLDAGRESGLLDEHVIPMFVAPPDICSEAGRTVYYGVVQTTSSELARAPPDTATTFAGFGPDSTEFTAHLIQPLQGLAYSFPDAGSTFNASYLDTLQAATDLARQRFLLLLRQVSSEFDAFGSSAESQAIFTELEAITLSYTLRSGELNPRTVAAGSFLKNAVAMLLLPDPPAGTLEMPASWPGIDDAARRRLGNALSAAMQARFSAVKGRPGRFDEPDAVYVLRAFVRLKAEGACPPQTLWSDYSEPFVIAPWYEGTGAPTQITLPDPDEFRSLKPNVSFLLPPKLQSLLGGSPKDMLEGKLKTGDVTLGWICSFSIPIITLCAFIVLNIFLSLFDLFFRWSAFIKICIPFPKIKGK